MDSFPSSYFKKVLNDLREKHIINENQLIQALEDLKSSSISIPDELVPSLDMLGLKNDDKIYQQLDQSVEAIDLKIKNIADLWNNKHLNSTETKNRILKLVSKRKEIISTQKRILENIQTKILRLKNLEKDANINLNKFDFNQGDLDARKYASDISFHFGNIWKKYSSEFENSSDLTQKAQMIDEIESDILSSLIVPIEDKISVFNLDEVIQPIDRHEPSNSLLPKENSIMPSDARKELDQKEDDTILKILPSPWDFVGKVVYNQQKEPLGLIRSPIVVNKIDYFPIVVEEPMSITVLKERYYKVLKQADLDLKTTKTQKIRGTIASSLQVPEKLALYPSIFNEWISIIGSDSIPVKPVLKKVQFLEVEAIDSSNPDQLIINEEDLKQITVDVWIPSRGTKDVNKITVGDKIVGMAGSHFGSISNVILSSPFGQSLIIKRDVPPSYLLTLFLDGLGIQNLAGLRFNIAKNLGIGEGEAFSSENLWTINEKERLLISPHEIYNSYYSILPAEAFTFSDIIKAKIGVYFHSIPETFHYLNGKQIKAFDGETGSIYGFSMSQNQLQVLWSSKSSIEIIKEVGRKSSERYVSRFKKRIALALGISYQESLWPSNLARYFLNFIWMNEGQSLLEAMLMIEDQFSLNKTLFSDIKNITKDGLECKNPG